MKNLISCGNTGIFDGLGRTVAQSEALSCRNVESLSLGAGAVRPGKAGDFGRHRQRGGGEESGGDEGEVELHYVEIVEILNEREKRRVR
jgi:hypothetical protein